MRTDALKTKSTTKTKQTLHNYPQTLPNSDTAQLPIETLPKTNTAQLPTETQVSANIATITLRNSAKLKHHTTACRNSAKNKHCTITDRNSPRNKHYPNTHRNSAKTLPKTNTAQGRLAAGALSVCKHLNWTSISRRTKQAHTVLQAAFSSQNDQLFNSPPPPTPTSNKNAGYPPGITSADARHVHLPLHLSVSVLCAVAWGRIAAV